jgi:hypothetical protein
MTAALELVDNGSPTEEIESQRLAKVLADFNLPDDQKLLIGWTQNQFEDGCKHFFLAGLGLIKLHQTKPNTYSVIIDENFPGLNLRVAENYMAASKAMINHPAFEAFKKERGAYSKILTALRICNEPELQEADKTGELRGFKMDQLAKMSVRTMQKALVRAEAKMALAVKKARAESEPLKLENANLKAEVEGLKAAITDPDRDAALKIIRSAENKFIEGATLIGKISPELLERDETVRNLVFVAVDMLNRLRTEMVGAAQKALDRALAAEGGGDE